MSKTRYDSKSVASTGGSTSGLNFSSGIKQESTPITKFFHISPLNMIVKFSGVFRQLKFNITAETSFLFIGKVFCCVFSTIFSHFKFGGVLVHQHGGSLVFTRAADDTCEVTILYSYDIPM